MCTKLIPHTLVSNPKPDRRQEGDEMTHADTFADFPEDVSLRRRLLVHPAAKYEHSCGGTDGEPASAQTDFLSKHERRRKYFQKSVFY